MSDCILSIAQLSQKLQNTNILSEQLLCFEEECCRRIYPSDRSVFINGHTFLLLTEGEAHISINGQDYNLSESDLVILAPIHSVRLCRIEPGSRCQILLASKYFLNESLSLPYIQLYNRPIIHLSSTESKLLSSCMSRIRKSIKEEKHQLYQELVLNALQYFLIELNNTLITGHRFRQTSGTDRENIVFNRFISLLLKHYRDEHNTAYYAGELNMSIQNLCRIIKKVANVTPNEFISEMLFTEARRLLSETDMPTQQIASDLKFSDQSAFGKFFKRQAGVSPSEYRENSVMAKKFYPTTQRISEGDSTLSETETRIQTKED